MNPHHAIDSLFECPVCNSRLKDPVTLSCGYTVCKHCLPSQISSGIAGGTISTQEQRTFICPVTACQQRAHLFGRYREIHVDTVIDALISAEFDDTSKTQQRVPLIKKRRMEKNMDDGVDRHEHLLECPKCSNIFSDPITTHCGHVFCKVCLLKLSIQGDPCIECHNPLPRFNHFLNQATVNRILQQMLFNYFPSARSSSTSSLLIAESQQPMPVFVTGLVILPKQHARLPVYAPAHIRMFREAVFSGRQQGKLYLATVHRGRPSMAHYGTIVEIISIETPNASHTIDNGMVLDVVGCERFTASDNAATTSMSYDISVLTAFCSSIPANNNTMRDDERIDEIRQFLNEIARHPPPAIEWGTLWFNTMERIHGQLPPRHASVEEQLWWIAIVLPVSATERYSLLCIIPLDARLSLVLSWTRQLREQWSSQHHQ
ncbi:hypothetical protein K492DRAFT_171403 [Lichtheimia hyalospora FSU 10163]|nr:hypothetical protein K492DRAFT_171403 [Lichtheimia hyalospora FSU 10163]